MDTMLELPIRGKFYGVRGSFPYGDVRVGGHTTCHSMQFGDKLIIFDTGSGMIDIGDELMKRFLMPGRTMTDVEFFMSQYFAKGLKAELLGQALINEGILGDSKGLEVTVIHSHLHGDHLYGLQAFKPIFLASTKIHFISATHDKMNSVEVLRNMVFAHPVFPVKWDWLASERTHQLVHPCEWFEIPCDIGGPIRVFCLPMNHPNQAYGFRFVWGGKEIAITMDHEHGHDFDRHILELWEDADIVVTEAQYTNHQYVNSKGYGHISEDAVGQHAKDSKPRRIITTHHDPGSSFGDIRDIARTIERISGVRTEFACQGTMF